jgi:hypothetical protein
MSMKRRNLPARGDLVQRRTQALGAGLCSNRCDAEQERGSVAFELPLGLKEICHREALFDRDISAFKQSRPGIDHGRGVEFTL